MGKGGKGKGWGVAHDESRDGVHMGANLFFWPATCARPRRRFFPESLPTIPVALATTQPDKSVRTHIMYSTRMEWVVEVGLTAWMEGRSDFDELEKRTLLASKVSAVSLFVALVYDGFSYL